MLTFECCFQQLLGLCIKRLDFILLSTRIPHDHPTLAALYWVELMRHLGRRRGDKRGSLRPRVDWPVHGTGALGQSLALGGWLITHQAWLLVENGH